MEYKTLKQRGESEYIVKKSRFIGYAAPVSSGAQAQEFIARIKKLHKDARHNTSAYVISEGEKRCSDDGEPQGTAGVPILEVIEKQGLTGVCIVVTRYFGGILLGTGGLIRAYSAAASQAVTAAGVAHMQLARVIEAEIDYSLYGKVNYILPEFTHKLIASEFNNGVKLTVAVKSEQADSFSAKITELSAGRAKIKTTEEKYVDFNAE